MEREEMKEAVREFDNIVFVCRLENLNLWHTQNFSEGFDCHRGKQGPDVHYSNNRASVELLGRQSERNLVYLCSAWVLKYDCLMRKLNECLDFDNRRKDSEKLETTKNYTMSRLMFK